MPPTRPLGHPDWLVMLATADVTVRIAGQEVVLAPLDALSLRWRRRRRRACAGTGPVAGGDQPRLTRDRRAASARRFRPDRRSIRPPIRVPDQSTYCGCLRISAARRQAAHVRLEPLGVRFPDISHDLVRRPSPNRINRGHSERSAMSSGPVLQLAAHVRGRRAKVPAPSGIRPGQFMIRFTASLSSGTTMTIVPGPAARDVQPRAVAQIP